MGFLGRLGEGLSVLGAFAPGAGTAFAGAGGLLASLDSEDPEQLVTHPYAGSYDYRAPFAPGAYLYGLASDFGIGFERRSWMFDDATSTGALAASFGQLVPGASLAVERDARAWGRAELERTGEPERVLDRTTFRDAEGIYGPLASQLGMGLSFATSIAAPRGYRWILERRRFAWTGGGPQLDYMKAGAAVEILTRWVDRIAASNAPGFAPVFWWIDSRPIEQRAPEIALRALGAPGMLRVASGSPADFSPGPEDRWVLSRVSWADALHLALTSTEEPWASARAQEAEQLAAAAVEYDEEHAAWSAWREQRAAQAEQAAAADAFESALGTAWEALQTGNLTEEGFYDYLGQVLDLPGIETPSETPQPIQGVIPDLAQPSPAPVRKQGVPVALLAGLAAALAFL